MSQHISVLAAHAVARQLDPAGILNSSRGRPGSARSDSSDCSDADTAAVVTQTSPEQRSLKLDCIGEDHEQQYPHFFAWLHAHKKKSSCSNARPCSAQPITTRSSSKQQRTSASRSSRPASAASCLQTSGQLSAVPMAQRQQHTLTRKSSTSAASRPADVSCSTSRVSQSMSGRAASRPSSRAANTPIQQQQQHQQCRPWSDVGTRQQQQQHQGRKLQQPEPCIGSSFRPQSAAVSVLNRSSTPKQRPHTAGWLAGCTTGAHQHQEQGTSANTLLSWLQVTAAQQQQGAAKHPAAAAAAATQQQPRATDGSSGNPWALFGQDATATWQQLDTPAARSSAGGLRKDLMLQSTGSMLARLDIRPDSPSAQSPGTAKASGSAADTFRSACSTPDGARQHLQQQQQQQDAGYPRAARQLFQQLPLAGNASMNRQGLQLLALGLQGALQQAGAPLQLQLPQYGCGVAAGGSQEPNSWSAYEQLAPELRVWDALLAELCRQAHAECSHRGALLLSAITRQQQMLRSALSACDGLHSAMQQAAAAARQQKDIMVALEQQLEQAQQQNEQLTAGLAASNDQLESAAAELAMYKERLRKGRFHIITEQVQQAKVALQQCMLEEWEAQLQAAKLQWQQEEAAARSAWQQQLMQEVQEALGQEVADSLRMLQTLQRSSDNQRDDGEGAHAQQLQADEVRLPAAAAEAAEGCLAEDAVLDAALLKMTGEPGVEQQE